MEFNEKVDELLSILISCGSYSVGPAPINNKGRFQRLKKSDIKIKMDRGSFLRMWTRFCQCFQLKRVIAPREWDWMILTGPCVRLVGWGYKLNLFALSLSLSEVYLISLTPREEVTDPVGGKREPKVFFDFPLHKRFALS